MTRFDGKVALVTGGRSGIGRAIAARLVGEGARVFTAQRSTDPNGDVEGVRAELTHPDAPANVIDEIARRAGRLDILVNNAGSMRQTDIGALSLEGWQDELALNLTAPFLLIQSALPLLKSGPGTIVNIGSIEGLGANPGHAAYCASKAGLHGLTCAVAVDLGKDGIRCNTVAPGWIDTELNEEFIESMEDPAAFRNRIGGIHPLRRTGRPEEVAALVAFLASDEAGFITGELYRIDGGRMTRLSLP